MINRKKLINEIKYRMEVHINDDEEKDRSWKRQVEIMAEDEKDAIEFIKDNYDCDPEDSSDYRWYISESMESYFENTESKAFIKELWEFFKEEKYKKNRIVNDYMQRLESIIVYNDWDEEFKIYD